MNSAVNVSFGICFLLGVLITMMAGRFLKHVKRTDPNQFKQIWSESGAVLDFFYPIRIALLYVIPRAFEDWNLDSRGRGSARRLRIVSIAFLVLVLLTLVAMIMTNI